MHRFHPHLNPLPSRERIIPSYAEDYIITRPRRILMFWRLTSCLRLSTQTSSANFDFPLFSIYDNRISMDIRQPLPFGMSLRVAYSIPKLSSFATDVTLHKSFSPLFRLPLKNLAFPGTPKFIRSISEVHMERSEANFS